MTLSPEIRRRLELLRDECRERAVYHDEQARKYLRLRNWAVAVLWGVLLTIAADVIYFVVQLVKVLP